VKNSLGNLLALLLFTASVLYAEDFTFARDTDNPAPYVKEGILLSVDLNQTNPDIVLLFNFDLVPSEDYTFQRIDSRESDSYHNAKVHYLYLLYPLKAGEIDVNFSLIKRVTNDESVAYSFSGDRDNVKGLVTQNSQIDLPPLKLHVKPLPKQTVLVGDFTLTYDLKRTEAEAYEPVPFRVTIRGRGYPPLLQHLLPEHVPFTLFRETPVVKSTHDAKGTHNTVIYTMALSHDRDFTIPAVSLKAFDPERERSYTLEIPQTPIRVKQPDVNTLVDTVDTPPPLRTDWGWLTTLMGYLIAFGAGFASAQLLKWQRKLPAPSKHPLAAKIDACGKKKQLLQLLLAQGEQRFAPVIEKLESDLYGNKNHTLTSLKKEAKELLQ
jgi:hypothetical protein